MHHHIDGLVQNCSNSIANALELLQSRTKPSIYGESGSFLQCYQAIQSFISLSTELLWSNVGLLILILDEMPIVLCFKSLNSFIGWLWKIGRYM